MKKATNMKNKYLYLIAAAVLSVFFSCENIIGLGEKVVFNGPQVTITAPEDGKPQSGPFVLEANVKSPNNNDIGFIEVEIKFYNTQTDTQDNYPQKWRFEGPVCLYSERTSINPEEWSTWAPYDGVDTDGDGNIDDFVEITGNSKNWTFKLPIDMSIIGDDPADIDPATGAPYKRPKDGSYMFFVTSQDTAGNKDSYSTRSVRVVVSNKPPNLTVIRPQLFISGTPEYADFNTLKLLSDNNVVGRRSRTDISRLLSGQIPLRFRLSSESKVSIAAVDVRFYESDGTDWTDPTSDPANDRYFYRTYINDIDNYDAVDLTDMLAPLYRIDVPDLSYKASWPAVGNEFGGIRVTNVVTENGFDKITYDNGRMEYLKEITSKKTLVVVVRCIDAAGMDLGAALGTPGTGGPEDKGEFIYWPNADEPWLEFPDRLQDKTVHAPIEHYDPGTVKDYFPDSIIPVTAFDNNAVYSVEFRIDQLYVNAAGQPINTSGAVVTNPDDYVYDDLTSFFIGLNDETIEHPDTYNINGGNPLVYKVLKAPQNSRSFSWDFSPPSSISGIYRVHAIVHDAKLLYDNDLNIIGQEKGRNSSEYTCFYKVFDASFPFIDDPYTPDAIRPLFEALEWDSARQDFKFTIKGYAYDSTEVRDVAMAWINPSSANYAAMSQLAFFRDGQYGSNGASDSFTYPPLGPGESYPPPHPIYPGGMPQGEYGWAVTPINENDPPRPDRGYDRLNPNLVWKMNLDEDTAPIIVTNIGDGNTYRRHEYSKTIYLKDIGIDFGVYGQAIDPVRFLKGQVFVFKATDIDDKATIIAWAPAGDSSPPTITLGESRNITPRNSGVKIIRNDPNVDDSAAVDANGELKRSALAVPLHSFEAGDKIQINGTWSDDSYRTYPGISREGFIANFINKRELGAGLNITVQRNQVYHNPPHAIKNVDPNTGRWNVEITVSDEPGALIRPGYLAETMVIGASYIDLGGNPAEETLSWLVQSEDLSILRVGSDTLDGHYNVARTAGAYGSQTAPIEIFLEFNKPVVLDSHGTGGMILPGSPTNQRVATLYLKDGASSSYTTGPSEIMAYYDPANPKNAGSGTRKYFTYRVAPGHNIEWLTVSGINSGVTWSYEGETLEIDEPSSLNDPARTNIVRLPKTNTSEGSEQNRNDYPRTLKGSKVFTIDTTPPVLDPQITNNFRVNPSRGDEPVYLNEGETLYFTYFFNEPVMISKADSTDADPRLMLNIQTGTGTGQSDIYSLTDEEPVINDRRLQFSYTITADQRSINQTNFNYSNLRIYGIEASDPATTYGRITDLAGNEVNISQITKDMERIFVDSVEVLPPNLSLITNTAESGSPVYETLVPSVGSQSPWTPIAVVPAPAGPISGASDVDPAKIINLGLIFMGNLSMEIGMPDQNGKVMESYFEYSIDDGRLWTRQPYTYDHTTPLILSLPYTKFNNLTMRFVDKAGNVSDWTNPIVMEWDPEEILELVSSDTPNGKKTNTQGHPADSDYDAGGRQDEIEIRMQFRHPVTVTAVTAVLNIGQRDPANPDASVDPNSKFVFDSVKTYGNIFIDPVTGAETSKDFYRPVGAPANFLKNAAGDALPNEVWSFIYYVQPYDMTPENSKLEILDLNIEAIYTDINAVTHDIGEMVKVTDATNRLHTDKDITIETGYPVLMGGHPVMSNSSRDTTNDSFNTRLEFVYSSLIFRGPEIFDIGTTDERFNEIKITQQAAGYRLPVVLSVTDRARYRTALNSIYTEMTDAYYNDNSDPNGMAPLATQLDPGEFIFDRYYTRGTNGLNDTTTKFILNFNVDPYAITPNRTGTDEQKFAELFRRAEAVVLSISSNTSIIEIIDNRLIIYLDRSNSLKVIGAVYDIELPNGFVQNDIGNPCKAYNGTITAVDTTAANSANHIRLSKPFIRVNKAQERITVQTPNGQTPRITATQPGQTQIRMDSRTPASRVVYIGSSYIGTDGAVGTNGTGNDNSRRWVDNRIPASHGSPSMTGNPATTPVSNDTPTLTTVHSGTRFIFGTTNGTAATPVSIGPAAETGVREGMFQGYKFGIRAVSIIGEPVAGNFGNQIAEDIAYRTVIVFDGQSKAGHLAVTYGSGAGYSLWIRGANTLTNTTVTGFPLTLSDNYGDLQRNRERAGIRSMSKIDNSTNNDSSLESSVWQFVTWEMEVPAFFDIFIGYDNTPILPAGGATLTREQLEDRIFQYGPLFFASHMGDWTPLKQYYKAINGERRWLNNTGQYYARQPIYTFGAFDMRPDNMATTLTQP